jgi:hypothetical protein
MKFNRLVTFGDSFTYGENMPDNVRKTNKPSEYAWPSVVAKKLDVNDIVNCAIPGASNKYISKSILDFKFQKHDLVLVLWSWHNRWHVFNNNNLHKQKIGLWKTKYDKTSDLYYRYFYNEEDSIRQSLIYVNHVNDYLKHKKVKNFHAFLDEDMQINAQKYEWHRTEILPFRVRLVDYANDGSHPGVKSHIQIAKQVWINMKGQLYD